MIINREIVKKIYIYAQSAEPVPPLGTILSNLGADTKIFCTQFNNKTLELPTYLLLKTTITIATNKSTSFTIDLPSTTSILTLLQFEKIIKVRVYDR
jgi:ribosomal protein L11